MYGSSEVVQAYARLAAVNGVIQVLSADYQVGIKRDVEMAENVTTEDELLNSTLEENSLDDETAIEQRNSDIKHSIVKFTIEQDDEPMRKEHCFSFDKAIRLESPSHRNACSLNSSVYLLRRPLITVSSIKDVPSTMSNSFDPFDEEQDAIEQQQQDMMKGKTAIAIIPLDIERSKESNVRNGLLLLQLAQDSKCCPNERITDSVDGEKDNSLVS